ncbi:uncharacterized protein LOC114648749 isoform X2 [Erpetoichthys calabaricus]|uniref:uncharacterized protein LOC114648749 isoform X2 n=1 Tax=Erpetoichthys calabaricus TaxID=27687 RepID=UPI00109FF7AD|nr:uncharacterized protein LOC114648749 isoform X2 [Erpetoichthys calabaricus]
MIDEEEEILSCLENLESEQFKRFKDRLLKINFEGFQNISSSDLENADKIDTKKHLVSVYGKKAFDVTVMVLEKIKLRGYASELRAKKEGQKRTVDLEYSVIQEIKRPKLHSSFNKSSELDELDGPLPGEISLAKMEDFADRNREQLICKLKVKEKFGGFQILEKKQLFKLMKLKDSWILNWKKAKEVSKKLSKSEPFHWSLVEEQLFERYCKTKGINRQVSSENKMINGEKKDQGPSAMEQILRKKEDIKSVLVRRQCSFSEDSYYYDRTNSTQANGADDELMHLSLNLATEAEETKTKFQQNEGSSTTVSLNLLSCRTPQVEEDNFKTSDSSILLCQEKILLEKTTSVCRENNTDHKSQNYKEHLMEDLETKGQDACNVLHRHGMHKGMSASTLMVEEKQSCKTDNKKDMTKDKMHEYDSKVKAFGKWVEKEVIELAAGGNQSKEERQKEILSNIQIRDTWEHSTYKCLTANNCILYTDPKGALKLVHLENSKLECLTKSGEPREDFKFKWQYHMWIFQGVKTDIVFSESEDIQSYPYDEEWFRNFHIKFPKFLKEEALPAIALYKEAQQEKMFSCLANDNQE